MGAIAVWGYAVQALLALSWTLYALLLPPLLGAVGLDAAGLAMWLGPLLIADQIAFAAADCAAGVWAARVGRAAGRLARPIALFAFVSSAALCALPWLARTGSAALLAATTIVWVLGSSLLRAPLLALLGRATGTVERTRRVAAVAIGLALAGACAPQLTTRLAGVDARLPLALAATALALAALYVGRVEAHLPPVPAARPSDTGPTPALFAGALLAAAAAQLHTALASKAQYAAHGGGGDWLALFWLGCALGGLGAARLARWLPELRGTSVALATGSALLVLAAGAPDLATLAAAQGLAGGAWGVALATLFAGAARRGSSSLGLLFAALALAVVIRIGLQRAGLDAAAAGRLAAGGWLLAAAVLYAGRGPRPVPVAAP